MIRPDFTFAFSAAIAALASFTAAPALAQDVECTSDADCGHGFVCDAGSYTACPDIACAPGEACQLPDCEETAYASCVLAPCEQDSDCPSGLTCESETYQDCVWDDVACVEGQPCPEPEPHDCTDVTEHFCAAPWDLPCTQDSDCGDGFLCKELESCGCAGSAGSAGSSDSGGSGDSEPVPEPMPAIEPEPDCSCTPSGEFYCEQQEIVCAADTDCPSDWTCDENPLRPVCMIAGVPGGEPMPAPDCGGDAPERTCQPPYYARGGGGFATVELAATSGIAPMANADAAPVRGPAPLQANDDAVGSMESASSGPSAGGCAVSTLASSTTPAAWLLALGLLALRRRRR